MLLRLRYSQARPAARALWSSPPRSRRWCWLPPPRDSQLRLLLARGLTAAAQPQPPASFGGAAAAAAAGGQSQCVSFPPSLLLNAGGEEAGDREIRMQSTYEHAVQYAGCKTSAPNRTRVKGGIVKRGSSNNSASGGSISDTAGGATASSTRITCAASQTPAAEDAHALFYQL